MTPDEIEALRGDLLRNCTPHLGNLQQKLSRVEVGTAQHGWLLDVFRRYAELVDRIRQTHPGEPLADLVAFLDEYLGFCKSLEKKDRLFNWRSDFAGSVIPEVLHRLIVKSVERMGLHPVFSSGDAFVEMTLPGGGRGWNVGALAERSHGADSR